MALGSNVNLKDKLIKKTVEASSTSNASNTSPVSKKSKAGNDTADTVKMTFYIKRDLLKKLYNYAYWERHSVTEAFNQALTDGLKGKNTKDKE